MRHLVKCAIAGFAVMTEPSMAANCIEVTITGVQRGPPVFAGQAGSGTLVTYGTGENNCRDVQSTAKDLGAMAQRAGSAHLMPTHLIPPIGAPLQGVYPLPAALTNADYEGAARNGGFAGNVVVGADLAKLRLVGE